MGPVIILDKSALQALSREEIFFLHKHYFVNLLPVLFAEVLGDLHKYGTDKRLSRSEVGQVARKLTGLGAVLNGDHRTMIEGELLGFPVPMKRKPALFGGRRVNDSSGGFGIVFDESPEQLAALRWSEGRFEEIEEAVAAFWRRHAASADLARPGAGWDRLVTCRKKPATLDEAARQVKRNLTLARDHRPHIQWLTRQMGFPPAYEATVLTRWDGYHAVFMETAAPYSYYCVHLLLTFSLGLESGLVPPKPTNRIDLEYLFYLPFCRVFATRDKQQRSMAAAFLEQDQDLVDGNELKSDLARLAEEWSVLSEDERREREYDYGRYPLNNEDSLTSRLWKKYMRPWELGSGNKVVKMTDAEKRQSFEELRPIIDALRDDSSQDDGGAVGGG